MSSPTLGTCSSSGSAQFLSPAGLNGYVPRWLLHAACEGAAPPRPRIVPMRAAVVFADISGFSRLTRLYQEKGKAGVEELSLIIGDYLGKMERALGKAYTEPASDVRGYITHVKSQKK